MGDIKGKKEVWIDVLRAFACICVLLVHSPAKYDGHIPGQYVLAPCNYLFMAWGVSVFFMISGALLFYKAQDLKTFYKKRFSRILIPIVVWSIIYIFFDDLFYQSDKSHLHRILMIPLTQQTTLLWFMYTLVGIYLIAPVISTWLSTCSKRDVEIVLGLWGITLLLPYLKLLDPDCDKIIGTNGVLHNFYGFVGYALLGYYIRKYINIPVLSWKYLLLVIFSFGFPLFIFVTKILPIDVLNQSMSISAASMSAVAFIYFKNLNYKEGWILNIILKIAEFSFGIYLCQMLFLTPLRHSLTQYHIHYALQIPITAIVAGALSFLFVWGLSKLPRSKWLFG